MKYILALAFGFLWMQPPALAATGEEIKDSLKSSLPATRTSNADEYKPSIGVFAGSAQLRHGKGSGSAYGIEYGLQPIIPFSNGIALSGSVIPTQDNATITRTQLFYHINYNFGGTIPVIRYSYIGLGAGIVWDNYQNKSDLELGWAPRIGFDIPVADQFTLGVNANYLMSGGDKESAVAVNGMAKYWF